MERQNMIRNVVSQADHLVKRMKKDKCFTCGVEGHWSRSCPYKTPFSGSSKLYVAKKDYEVPAMYCSICKLLCVVKEINGVKKFCCPRGKPFGCGRMKDFEKVEAPQCTCGAGTASVHEWMKMDENHGRTYFACRVRKGHGACSFFEWKDIKVSTPVNHCVGGCNNEIPLQSSMSDTDTVDSSNKRRRVGFSPPQPKRLNFDCLGTEETYHCDKGTIAQMESRKYLADDSFRPLFVKEADFMITSENIPSKSKSIAEIKHKNLKSSILNCAAGSITIGDPSSKFGGLGDNQVRYTPCSLSACQLKPSSCGMPNSYVTGSSQNMNKLTITKSSTLERNLIAGSSSHSHGQAFDDSPVEPLVNRKQIGDSLVLKANSNIAQENWQAVTCLEETFDTILKSMDPFDVKLTIQKAENIIGALACLGVDTKPLQEQLGFVSKDLKNFP